MVGKREWCENSVQRRKILKLSSRMPHCGLYFSLKTLHLFHYRPWPYQWVTAHCIKHLRRFCISFQQRPSTIQHLAVVSFHKTKTQINAPLFLHCFMWHWWTPVKQIFQIYSDASYGTNQVPPTGPCLPGKDRCQVLNRLTSHVIIHPVQNSEAQSRHSIVIADEKQPSAKKWVLKLQEVSPQPIWLSLWCMHIEHKIIQITSIQQCLRSFL